eukprot:TRINITY_DN5308_c0_g2_i2.p1 TRINITY_DN5308_c0_g2~~TRINITY_DN5308_c0_g2_i2.p1  ORF type:complete len:220 (-),score=48.68 TRINITY_DN5308_c0_g2_i2:127-765(-)
MSSGQTLGVKAQRFRGHTSPHRNVKEKKKQHEGIKSFYTGVVPAIASVAPSGAVFYGTYDVLKTAHLHKFGTEVCKTSQEGIQMQLPASATLLYGGIAGVAAESVVYPLEVLRREMQVQSAVIASVLKSGVASVDYDHYGYNIFDSHFEKLKVNKTGTLTQIKAAVTQITRTKGLRGFYSGLAPNILQVMPNAAIGYFTYEYLRATLNVKEM